MGRRLRAGAGERSVKTANIVYMLYTDILYSFPMYITIKTFSIKGVIEMSWERKTVEDTRLEFVLRALCKEKSKSALCREYGISRPTGDKWISRYLSGEELSDLSRRPFHSPNKIPADLENSIILHRLKEPALGAAKIRRMLENEGYDTLPAVSTVNKVLKRNDLIAKEASLAAKKTIRFEKAFPNDMWQADFKGDFLLRDGTRCYPLSILDDCSRMCLCSDAKSNTKFHDTKASFIKTFENFGLPNTLLCDNGNPWGAAQSGGITTFDTWMMELGILPIHIRSRHPQTQGKVERFNGSYKRERLRYYLPLNMEDAQRSREEYMTFYNSERPHNSLNLDCPAQHYVCSDRSYTETIPKWDYEPGGELRRIKDSGYLTYKGQGYFLSEGMRCKELMIYPMKNEKDKFELVFRQFRIGILDISENVILSKKVFLWHNDPRLE